ASPEMIRGFAKLESAIHKILGGTDEPPSLLHGDLWSGNFLTDDSGEPCLIDPAVYYGHREADLAMTSLFGGFSNEFYQSYQETFPLIADYEYREPLYQLYHVMNHLNLFGSGYYGQALSILKFYQLC
ncbi:MAG: fructosamine kinase family protein, partial [SAR324 cluster bacterium]|nr:fructosamine kinase family protein [SAR324 cluster bacterium]